MSVLARLFAGLILAFSLALPVAAVQPKGSAGWTTEGWTNYSGTLYHGPGTQYDVTGAVEAGIRVRVDRCSALWCLIHTPSGSNRGWMSLDNISFGQGPWIPFAQLPEASRSTTAAASASTPAPTTPVRRVLLQRRPRLAGPLSRRPRQPLPLGQDHRRQRARLPRPQLPQLLQDPQCLARPSRRTAERRDHVDPRLLITTSHTMLQRRPLGGVLHFGPLNPHIGGTRRETKKNGREDFPRHPHRRRVAAAPDPRAVPHHA